MLFSGEYENLVNTYNKVIHRGIDFAMEMTVYWMATAVLTGFLCSLVASIVLILFGGYGGFLLIKKDVQGLRYEVEKQEERLVREVKQRAAYKGVQAKGSLDEVDRILAAAESAKENDKLSPSDLEARRAKILAKARGV